MLPNLRGRGGKISFAKGIKFFNKTFDFFTPPPHPPPILQAPVWNLVPDHLQISVIKLFFILCNNSTLLVFWYCVFVTKMYISLHLSTPGMTSLLQHFIILCKTLLLQLLKYEHGRAMLTKICTFTTKTMCTPSFFFLQKVSFSLFLFASS